MATIDPIEIQLHLSEELKNAIEEAKAALSEERIRAIVREELAAWEKQQAQRLRISRGRSLEVK